MSVIALLVQLYRLAEILAMFFIEVLFSQLFGYLQDHLYLFCVILVICNSDLLKILPNSMQGFNSLFFALQLLGILHLFQENLIELLLLMK